MVIIQSNIFQKAYGMIAFLVLIQKELPVQQICAGINGIWTETWRTRSALERIAVAQERQASATESLGHAIWALTSNQRV